MWKFWTVLIIGTSTFATTPVRAATYDIDLAHSHVAFFIDHVGFSRIIGVVNDFDGSFNFDAAKPEASSLKADLKAASISTNNPQRDSDIQGEKWFKSVRFPSISFNGKSFKKLTDKSGTISGDLTIAGVTHDAMLMVTFNKEGDNPWDHTHVAGFSATASILRSDFGLTTFIPLVGDKVDLLFEIEGIQRK